MNELDSLIARQRHVIRDFCNAHGCDDCPLRFSSEDLNEGCEATANDAKILELEMAPKPETRKIYCCGCGGEVDARLTNGKECYPHRKDLHEQPFWKCDACGNFVGTHHKMETNPTLPMGVIATREIKNARKYIHAILDPLWKGGHMKRGAVYAEITEQLGYTYHTGEIKTIEDARQVYRIVQSIWREKGLKK